MSFNGPCCVTLEQSSRTSLFEASYLSCLFCLSCQTDKVWNVFTHKTSEIKKVKPSVV